MNERLKKQLAFSLEIDKEKNIFRQTHLSGLGRNENDAEHAWHMAIMSYLLREYANEEVDILKVILMCLIHDVVEIDAGDTYAYDEESKKTQKAREEAAKERIYSLLPEDQKKELSALFDEFEAYETPEAKYAHALDNLQPLILNDQNGGSDWKEHGVGAKSVYGRQTLTRLGSERLFQEVTDVILKKHIREGSLPEDRDASERLNASVSFSSVFPYYCILKFERMSRPEKITLTVLPQQSVLLRLYGSQDGLNYERLLFDTEQEVNGPEEEGVPWVLTLKNAPALHALRLQIVDADEAPDQWIREIHVLGKECPEIPFVPAKDPISELIPYSETAYAAPIGPADIESAHQRLAARLLGEKAAEKICFRLLPASSAEEIPESYRVFTETEPEKSPSGTQTYDTAENPGRIVVEGSSGSALSRGLYHYLRDCCHMQVAEETRQLTCRLPLPEKELKGSAFERFRYANNYCTLSYTLPLRNEEEWLNELDWFALLGVNTVLDFTGMEAVWVLFLRRLGLPDEAIEDFIVDPFHTAWQLMQNIEGFGGPLHRGFIRDRALLARSIQHEMRLLGITPVRQGFAGMLPEACLQVLPGLRLYPQGEWNGIRRPAMLDPSSREFEELAALFYKCQEEILGPDSHFYAIDPYHEGGNRPQELTDGLVAERIMRAMLTHDKDAVWMVQAWRENPGRAFLSGLDRETRRDHLLILDLSAVDHPLHGPEEFLDTPWIYCMLDMFGGRISTRGDADVLAKDIPRTRNTARHMCGLGFTAEATRQNPVVFELLFDMAWEKEEVDLKEWIRDYALCRYGKLTPAVLKAWDLLLETAYKSPGFSHHGGYTQIFCYRPRLSMKKGYVENELNSEVLKTPYYKPEIFYLAVREMMSAYEDHRENAGFLYDLQECLRQALNLLGTEEALVARDAFLRRDTEAFDRAVSRFFTLLSACDRLMRTRKETLLYDWSGSARERGAAYDGFTADLFALNARMLITSWGYRETYKSLCDYAYRQYGGLLCCFYQKRWEFWFGKLREAWEAPQDSPAADPSQGEWFRRDWAFVQNGCPDEETAGILSPDEVFPEVMSTVLGFFEGRTEAFR